jgi:hypothetical protein
MIFIKNEANFKASHTNKQMILIIDIAEIKSSVLHHSNEVENETKKNKGIFFLRSLELAFLQCLKRKMTTTIGRSAPTEYICTHIHDS